MSRELRKMKNLALKISAETKAEEDIIAVLLFGSVAKGDVHPESDVDMVVVKDSHQNSIKRKESVRNRVKIDLWEHSYSFYENLFEKNWKPEEMFLYSLFLNILQECEVLYDRESKFEEYKRNAMKWVWPKNCKIFVKDELRRALKNYKEGDYGNFQKPVYLRKLFLLDTCRRLLDIGRPVSIRNKDYYLKCKEYFSVQDFERVFGRTLDIDELGSLTKKAMEIFHNEIKDREPWTELKDAADYLSNDQVFMATISLQNGAYYLGCRGLSNRDIDVENKGFVYPESEMELIRKSREHWREFHSMYKKIHNINAWNNQDINLIFHYLSKHLEQ